MLFYNITLITMNYNKYITFTLVIVHCFYFTMFLLLQGPCICFVKEINGTPEGTTLIILKCLLSGQGGFVLILNLI